MPLTSLTSLPQYLSNKKFHPEEANQFSATFQQYATVRFGMSRENSS